MTLLPISVLFSDIYCSTIGRGRQSVPFKLSSICEASHFLREPYADGISDGAKSIPKPTASYLLLSHGIRLFLPCFPSSRRLHGWSSVGRPSLHFQDPLNHSTAAAFAWARIIESLDARFLWLWRSVVHLWWIITPPVRSILGLMHATQGPSCAALRP